MQFFREKSNLIFTLIVLAYLVYAGVFIYQTSFVVEGERYFVLFDDAAISMTYAKNLAEGHGLVWNAGGERIEGFTNPLWVVYMAVIHFLPLAPSKIGLAIQISGAIFLAINLFFVKKIADELAGSNPFVSLIAVVFTASYYPLNNWSLQGMEVGVLAMFTSLAAWQTMKVVKQKQSANKIFWLVGACTLIRMDAAVIYLVILIILVWFQPDRRRTNLLWGLGILIGFLALQTGLRYAYYGEVLPNTYYLKMTGLPSLYRIIAGGFALSKLIWNMNWILFALPLIVLFFRRDPEVLLLGGLFAGQVVYSVYVGGDAWEHRGGANRYIATTISMYFVLAAYALWWLKDTILRKSFDTPNRWIELLANGALLAFSVVSLLSYNVLLDTRDWQRLALQKTPLFVVGQEEKVRIALALDKIAKPGASVALVSAGNIPYLADIYAIDLLGKSDAYIAHLDAKLYGGYENFRPGHNKWDYDYSIGELKPDMVIQLWEDREDGIALLMDDYVAVTVDGMHFSARKDSTLINWDAAEDIRPVTP